MATRKSEITCVACIGFQLASAVLKGLGRMSSPVGDKEMAHGTQFSWNGTTGMVQEN